MTAAARRADVRIRAQLHAAAASPPSSVPVDPGALQMTHLPPVTGGHFEVALEEEVDVSHVEGKAIDGLARMLTAPVAKVRASRPSRKK